MAEERSSAGALSVETNKEQRELIIERVFDAPRELVWRAFTEPEALAQWWGPRGWTVPAIKLDLRPGGVWHYCMRGPDGEESWGKAVYREIVPPERLVYVDAFSDAEGNVAEDMPQMVITMEFAEQGGKTKFTSRTQFATVEELEKVLEMGVVQGMTETLDRLVEYLAKG